MNFQRIFYEKTLIIFLTKTVRIIVDIVDNKGMLWSDDEDEIINKCDVKYLTANGAAFFDGTHSNFSVIIYATGTNVKELIRYFIIFTNLLHFLQAIYIRIHF